MNFFDLAPWGELLPGCARRVLGWGLMLGIAFWPPVQGWWMGQVEDHASDLTKRILDIAIPEPEPASASDPDSR